MERLRRTETFSVWADEDLSYCLWAHCVAVIGGRLLPGSGTYTGCQQQQPYSMNSFIGFPRS